MITIERHPNLDNWIEIRYFGKLLEQFTSRTKAYRFAIRQAKAKGARVYDWDGGKK